MPDRPVRRRLRRLACCWQILILALLPALPARASEGADPRVLLFDFEGGVAEWKGNPWGGGKARAEAAAGARFGKGALRVVYEEMDKGATVIAPKFAEDAPWRGRPWGGVSFWARGLDDEPHKLWLHVATKQPGTGFTYNFTVQGKEWRRYDALTPTFWSRQGHRVDWQSMTLLYFGSSRSQSIEVDQTVLEPPARAVPFDPDPVALCPRVDTAPKLDGVLDDPCWAKAGRIGGFVEHESGAPARDATEVRLCYDADRLYVGARLSLADATKMRATLTRRDAPVYEEDCLELFLDPEGRGDNHYQLALNALGTLMDRSRKEHLAFNADWQVKTARDAGGWSVEAAISFRSFASRPAPGTFWGFNVGREVPATREITGWSCTRGKFANRERWGQLLFTGRKGLAPPSPPALGGPGEANDTPPALGGPGGANNTPPALGGPGGANDTPPALGGPGGANPAPVLLEMEPGSYAVRWTPAEGQGSVRLMARIAAPGADSGIATLDVPAERAAAEEPLLLLRAPFTQPERPSWGFAAVTPAGEVVAYAAGHFQVFPPPEKREKPFLALLPRPRELKPGQGRFVLPAETEVRCVGLSPEDSQRLVAVLGRDLREGHGLRWGAGPGRAVTLVRADKSDAVKANLPAGRAAAFDTLPEEGYLLDVTVQGITIAARSGRGVLYGIQTFLQAVALSTPVGERPACPALSVRDFPALPTRAVTMSFPNSRWGHPNDAPFTPAELNDYLYRVLVRHKINTLVLIVDQAIKLDSHPELAGPAAWTKDQVREALDFCRAHYLDVIPLQTVLAHSNWFTLNHKDLWEDGDYHIACVSNPKTHQILTSVVTEIADLFEPRLFHLGMDEAWWKTLDVPEEKRCKLCAGKPKSEIFARQATRYHDLLAKRGIGTLIWADMLLPEHNGGVPYHTAKALEKLPKEIILCNWSTTLAPTSSKRLRDAGFRVIQSNSAGVNRQQAEWVVGNMMGCWSKAPWLVDSISRVQGYSYLTVVQAAERSWNPEPDIQADCWHLERSFVEREADGALSLLARQASPAAAGPARALSLAAAANLHTSGAEPAAPAHWFGLPAAEVLADLPEREVTVGGTRFELLPAGKPNAVAFGEQLASVPVGARVGALAFLHGCHLPDDQRTAFLDRFKQKEAIRGVPIGTLRVRYEDGSAEEVELRYGRDVLPWKIQEKVLPYCYGAVGTLPLATRGMRERDPRGHDASLFACQWGNTHPEKRVSSIEMLSAGTEAVPFILAVTLWPARSP